MISPIPKWVWKRYALLWKKFEDRPFTFEQAHKELKHLDRNVVSAMFNELKKAGWISANLGEGDSRKRIYTLANPVKLIEKIK